MARPLRIEIRGGRYHVTARGNERKPIYWDSRDRQHFVELLAELRERYGVRVHAYVLMDNHFHLLLETPDGNLSQAMQWLNVSYTVWFNRRHERDGHLFQGRFKAVVVQDDAGWQEVARYVHLNPVRVAELRLDKQQRIASRRGLGEAPAAELVGKRLQVLREWQWSSYLAYAGYRPAPAWLVQDPLGRLCGGRTEQEQRDALREHTERAVREGLPERPWDRLIAGIVLGTEAFAQGLRKGLKGDAREQPELDRLGGRTGWTEIVRAVEKAKGETWKDFCQRRGDWGRDAVLWLARRHARLRLRELAELAGGMDYAAVGQAVTRFGQRLEREPGLRRTLQEIQAVLLNV